MLEILATHFLSRPEQLILEMRRRGSLGRVELDDGTFIVLEWQATEAVNDPIYQAQGEKTDGSNHS